MQRLLAIFVKVPALAALTGMMWVGSGGLARAQLVAASCATDNEIGAEERAAIENGALSFVRNFVNSNASGAYELLAPTAKETISLDQLTGLVRQLAAPMAPFTDLRVVHTNLVKAMASNPGARVVCGSLGRPEDWSSVATKPMAEQAHVLVEAQTKNNGFTFTLWLIPEQGWNVLNFQMAASSMVGKTAQDILDLARRERESKHLFNATVLYARKSTCVPWT